MNSDSTERLSNDAVVSTDFSALNFNNLRKSFGQRPLTEQDEREREQGLMRLGPEISFLKLELSLPGVCSRGGII